MKQRIVALGSRPEFWLAGLLLWLLGSAGRSLGTPWGGVALTEALRWSAGISLMLALGHCQRLSAYGARLAVLLVGTLALLGVADGLRPDLGGMVGPYHDHQLYGSALLVLLPLTAALALTARANVWRLGGLAALAAGIVCLVLSQTRSAWAGGLAAALIFGWLCLRRIGLPSWQERAAALSAAVLLAGLAAVWMLLGSASLYAPVAARTASVTRLGSDGSWQARLTAWRGAGRLIEARPVIGLGLGRYPSTQRDWTQSGRVLGPETRPSLSEQAHNFYLQTAAEIGMVGVGLYLAALAAYAVWGVRRLDPPRRSAPTEDEVLVMAALSALAGQAVDAIASPSWQFAETSLFFWAVLGLGWAAGRQTEASRVSLPLLSLPLPMRWRFFSPQVAAGIAFVALAAEVLPVGLLSPVEAYDSTTVKPGSVVLQASATTATLGVPVTYQLTAQDNNGNPVNLTFDSNTVFTASAANLGDGAYTKYLSRDTAHGVMVFLIPTGTSITNGKMLKIQATFPSYLTTYSKPLTVLTN